MRTLAQSYESIKYNKYKYRYTIRPILALVADVNMWVFSK